MTIYIDIFFMVNFIMDFFLIVLTEELSSAKLRPCRRLIAALSGAALSVMHFTTARTALTSLLFGLLIPPGIILVALYPCGKKLFVRCILCFCASSFIVSGAASFLLRVLVKGDSGLTSPIIYLITGLIFLIAKNTCSMLKNAALKGEYRITIKYGGYSATRTGTLDTGNSLTDPATKNPVIVADELLLHELFSPSCNGLNLCEWVDSVDLRIIPYRTVDNEGIMFGFAPERVIINHREIPDVVIAISENAPKGGVLLNNAVM